MAGLKVRVTPKSSREAIEYSNGVARVWVRSAPSDGEANEALCRLLAKTLRLPASAVRIAKGHTSRNKLVTIDGLDDAEVQQRLYER